MAALSNPYIAGNPVRGQINFVGRQDILRDVQRVLRDPDANAIVLYGQRRIGKTSILFQLEQQLAETGAYLPVYFDLHDKTDLSLAEILYRLATQIARYVDVSGLDRAQFDDEGGFFRSGFLPQAVERTHKQLILLFDEFDTLDRPYKGQVSATFLPYLQRWMSRTGDVHFVLAMGRRPEDLSPHMLNAFRHVQARHVSLMDLAESLAIVRQSEHNHTLVLGGSGVNRICYWTQGHPYLTQLLCSEVWEEAYDDAPVQPPTISADEVDLAVEATLEQGANAFQWIWNGLPPSERLAMAAMAGTGKLTITREQLQDGLAERWGAPAAAGAGAGAGEFAEMGLAAAHTERLPVCYPAAAALGDGEQAAAAREGGTGQHGAAGGEIVPTGSEQLQVAAIWKMRSSSCAAAWR